MLQWFVVVAGSGARRDGAVRTRVRQSVPGLKEARVAGAARGTGKGKSRLANLVATQRL
jgi:hypothetical protein